MEDTLGVASATALIWFRMSLNPYCNGRYSWSEAQRPYNGLLLVLILVLMEDTLRASYTPFDDDGVCRVLILVLMEDTLRDINKN